MQKRFSDQVALVTGAGGDIGLATALRLAEEGATLALLDMDETKLNAAKSKVAAKGVRAEGYLCDVTDPAKVDSAVAKIISDLGKIDLLFNNAGYQGAFAPVHKYDATDFAKVMNINVTGAFCILKAVSAHMADRKSGSIVNMASMAGVGGPPNMCAYASSKFAVVGLTETAAKDLAPYNIRVNAVSPGLMGPGFMWDRQVQMQSDTNTQYFSTDPKVTEKQMIGGVPLRRCGTIEEIPGVVCSLLSDDFSYVTGVNIRISGGE